MDKGFTIPQTEKIKQIAEKIAKGIAADMMTAHQLTHGHLPYIKASDVEDEAPVVDEPLTEEEIAMLQEEAEGEDVVLLDDIAEDKV